MIRDHRHHPRDWRGFLYAYPVISRRSRGLSIGVNLNPDAACNFDCIYCQVDRTGVPRVRTVDVAVLRRELEALVETAVTGALFSEPEFAATPPTFRRLNDIAFSGDGEPTTCPQFADAVAMVAELKRARNLGGVKTVLITDACYLTRPAVVRGLEIMDGSHGEIWAKLDAGTEDYYRLINRPNYPLAHVVENIVHAARVRPVVIQSLFMRVHDAPPSDAEIDAYVGRLSEIVVGGGRLACVQVYTVARPPAQGYVTRLDDAEVARIADRVRDRTGLPVESFPG
ncbi:MAG: radical SAM protein [Phycisphaerales bacterium]|nr:radical SAM protein [Phycisphaerales bacterium]